VIDAAGQPQHVFVILNAAAAGFLHRSVRDICGQITSSFATHGITAEIFLGFGGSLEKRAEEAIAAGSNAVVAGGGDGTVGVVAGALVDTGVPLGILPLGRFNHFARDLGIPAIWNRRSKSSRAGISQPSMRAR